MFKKRGKKGSLNLSMNAIVVLILAITMLGLGLTFMRGLFKQATERVTEAVSAQELVNPPTVDSPLTAAPGDITMRTKDVGKIIVAYMSQHSGVDDCILTIDDSSPAGASVVSIAASSSSVYMQQDQINTWTVALTSKDGSATGTGIYTATMACSTSSTSYNKDIVVTVTS